MLRNNRFEPLWQDRDIRFDASSSELHLRPGERIIETFGKVEDTKGNTGEVGKFTVTDLRVIWQSLNKPRINLSIGFNNIATITSRMIHTKLRGKNEALYMMTKVNGTRYEFIFIRLEPVLGVSRELVDLVGQVCKAYVSTRLYRDLRLRSAILSPSNKQLKMLHSEQIYNTFNGVWNLSSDQGNLGTMYLTNVRVVWHANMNELFNISLPFIQIRNVKVRESKFGLALVIESSESSGGYVLGFRVDPIEKLNSVFEELNNLYLVHSSNPDYGVHSFLTYNLAQNSEADNEANGALGTNTISDVLQNTNGNGNVSTTTIMSLMAHSQVGNDNGTQLATNGFGEYESSSSSSLLMLQSSKVSNYEEIIDSDVSSAHSYSDAVAAYLADGESCEPKSHEWTYVPQLGLSIEKIKDGYTMESLWEVVEF